MNVGSTLSLTLGQEQKVVCDTQGYYPLDVTVDWLRESVKSGLLPEVLKTVLYSSHRHNQDGTYSLSAFFLLNPDLEDSGYKYTCRVQHQSLRTPIRKSFTLIVTGRLNYTHQIINLHLLNWKTKWNLPYWKPPKVPLPLPHVYH